MQPGRDLLAISGVLDATALCEITEAAGGAVDMISLACRLSKTVIKEHMSAD